MSLTYQVGQKGKLHLIHEGYEYQIAVESKKKIYYRCVQSRNDKKCPGKLHTENGNIVFNNHFHNHAPKITRIVAKHEMETWKK